jgi:hypothetical protein
VVAEETLSSVLSEFARTMVTDFPVQGILDHLVGRIVDVLPVTGAGVTLIEADLVPRYVAASDASALRFEQLQTDMTQGPCILAYHSGEAVLAPELATDTRSLDLAQPQSQVVSLRYSPSRFAMARDASVRSICTGIGSGASTQMKWSPRRHWRTSLRPTSSTPRPATTSRPSRHAASGVRCTIPSPGYPIGCCWSNGSSRPHFEHAERTPARPFSSRTSTGSRPSTTGLGTASGTSC